MRLNKHPKKNVLQYDHYERDKETCVNPRTPSSCFCLKLLKQHHVPDSTVFWEIVTYMRLANFLVG